jgi:hypothetical protein
MKSIKSVLALAVFSFILLACSQDSEIIDESFDLTVTVDTPIQNQVPHYSFDTNEKGIYHGIIVSTTTQSRGKIWINMGNDTQYYAFIKMVDGDEVFFDLIPQVETQNTIASVYKFEGIAGSFELDLTDFNMPIVNEATMNNHEFFISVAKSRSSSMASSITATFQEIGNPSFGGTWSLIADGTITSPNGNNGDGVTSLVITMGGSVYYDYTFDNFNVLECLGIVDFVPTINANGIENYVIIDNQTSPMADGMLKWSLGYNAIESDYMKWMFCQIVPAGEFSWIDNDGTNMKVGTILID